MCSVCRQFNHHPQCPYADEPAPISVGECEYCRKDIMTGQEMVTIDGYHYHWNCLSGLSAREIMDVLDISIKEAKEVV